ncbi:RHS repeat-associated core domain-containing protein [Porphyromonas endodontalis]|uniref:RHS repeat-associated core domain-containing protein n=1 Tax=Porphyromonas endodontalis TaxID=28124 RepID=UPI0036F2D797
MSFLFQGQYFDEETDLCYDRYRCYDPDSGNYISQDPIGLAGSNPNIYAYVRDTNGWIDPLGLDVYKLIATSDGWYPVYQRGQTDPVAYTRQRKGDTYKIGESLKGRQKGILPHDWMKRE